MRGQNSPPSTVVPADSPPRGLPQVPSTSSSSVSQASPLLDSPTSLTESDMTLSDMSAPWGDISEVRPAPQMHRLPRNKRKHTVVFKYCEEMNELNEAANNRPRSALIHSIQQENRHIRQLQQENKELRLALEEHQNVMGLIMSKYRQQVAKLVSVNSKQSQPNTQEQAKLAAQIERVSEMVAVMRKAASIGDDEAQQQQNIITALATENKGLREMLSIAKRSGSMYPLSGVDAETQTEEGESVVVPVSPTVVEASSSTTDVVEDVSEDTKTVQNESTSAS